MDELSGFEYASGDDDELSGEEMGAVSALLSRLRSRGRSGGRKLPPPAIINSAPVGAQRLSTKREPLGLGRVTFATTATTGTTFTFEVEPQRSFQPERLVLDVVRSAGAAAIAVNVTDITVGDMQQIPASLGCPAAMFRPDAVGAALDLSAASPGMKVRVTVTLSAAPGVGESVTIDGGFYGKVIGQ